MENGYENERFGLYGFHGLRYVCDGGSLFLLW